MTGSASPIFSVVVFPLWLGLVTVDTSKNLQRELSHLGTQEEALKLKKKISLNWGKLAGVYYAPVCPEIRRRFLKTNKETWYMQLTGCTFPPCFIKKNRPSVLWSPWEATGHVLSWLTVSKHHNYSAGFLSSLFSLRLHVVRCLDRWRVTFPSTDVRLSGLE